MRQPDDVNATGTAADLKGTQPPAPIQDQTPKTIDIKMVVQTPKTSSDAEKLILAYRTVTESEGGTPLTWRRLQESMPPGLAEIINNKVHGALKPDEPVEKALSAIAASAAIKTAGELYKALEVQLGQKTAAALVGTLGGVTAGVLAEKYPGLLVKVANENSPALQVLTHNGDHLNLKITLTPKLTEEFLPGGTFDAVFRASTADLNFSKKPPENGERVPVGNGTLIFEIKPDGAHVAVDAKGKQFTIPMSVLNDKTGKDDPVVSREAVSAYLSTQLKSKLPFEEPHGVISVNDLLPRQPAKDGQPPRIDVSGNAHINFSVGEGVNVNGSTTNVQLVRPGGPNSVAYEVYAGATVKSGEITSQVGARGVIPINGGGHWKIPFAASTNLIGPPHSTLSVGLAGDRIKASVVLETNGHGSTISVPIQFGKKDEGLSATITPTFNGNVGVEAKLNYTRTF